MAAGSTVQYAANTAFLSQFGVTIFLAVSLKAMWNLMHVMQVLAYMRLYITTWPANTAMMLQSVHNAITLENVLDGLYDGLGLKDDDNFEENEEDAENEEEKELEMYDISTTNLVLSLGIFGIFLGLLVFALLLYLLLRVISVRV